MRDRWTPCGGEADPWIECAGAPRDLGFDQGRACGEVLRARLRREVPPGRRLALRLGLRRGAGRRRARDLRRHFPHQAEALAALSLAARVPLAWLESQLGPEATGGVTPLGAGPHSLQLAAAGELVLRAPRPDGRFASVELARPWQTSALAGVNSAGLAALLLASGPGPEPVAAPAPLLLRDCLERFAGLEPALEWCRQRPAGGSARILLGDASGAAARIEISGADRTLRRGALRDLLAGAGAPPPGAVRFALDPVGRRFGPVGSGAPGAAGDPRWRAARGAGPADGGVQDAGARDGCAVDGASDSQRETASRGSSTTA